MEASVEQRLRSLELTTEALSRRMDSMAVQRQMISHQNSGNLMEQSNQQLSRTRGRLQPLQNYPPQAVHADSASIGPAANEQIIYSYQPIQASSTTVLPGPPANDSARFSYSPHTVIPNHAFVGGNYAPIYAPANAPVNQQVNALANSSENRWEAWSCCLLWFGLSKLSGAFFMLIYGAFLINSYINPICISPYKASKNQCCFQNNCFYSNTLTPGIILLVIGFVTGIIGIALLVKAHRFYKNNNATCC